MTSSAERLAAQILGAGAEQAKHRGVTMQHPMRAADRIALEHLGQEMLIAGESGDMPGTRNTLRCDPFERPFERPGAAQPQYRPRTDGWAQGRRPVVPQAAQQARGVNHWGSADQRQLNGIAPEPRAA